MQNVFEREKKERERKKITEEIKENHKVQK